MVLRSAPGCWKTRGSWGDSCFSGALLVLGTVHDALRRTWLLRICLKFRIVSEPLHSGVDGFDCTLLQM